MIHNLFHCSQWAINAYSLGRFLHEDLIQRDRTLEDTVTELKGEEKEQFLDFARCMLHWLPEKRKTAAELLEHPFIVSLEDEE